MKVYIDPYTDPRTGVLKNRANITNQNELDKMEAEYTSLRMKQLTKEPLKGEFDFERLCKTHEKIFGDVFEWAGSPRIINMEKCEEVLGGLSIEYAEYSEIQQRANSILEKMNAVDWKKLS